MKARLESEHLLSWFPGQHERPRVIVIDEESPANNNATPPSDSRPPVPGTPQDHGSPSSPSPEQPGIGNTPLAKKPKKKKMVSQRPFKELEKDEFRLAVKGAVVNQLRTIPKKDILQIYGLFFNDVFDTLKSSRYRDYLRKVKKWSSRKSYADFTPPWIRHCLTLGTEVVFLNPLAIRAIPEHRVLRSTEGARKATFILSAFYTEEPVLRPFLDKHIYDVSKIKITYSGPSPYDRIKLTRKEPERPQVPTEQRHLQQQPQDQQQQQREEQHQYRQEQQHHRQEQQQHEHQQINVQQQQQLELQRVPREGGRQDPPPRSSQPTPPSTVTLHRVQSREDSLEPHHVAPSRSTNHRIRELEEQYPVENELADINMPVLRPLPALPRSSPSRITSSPSPTDEVSPSQALSEPSGDNEAMEVDSPLPLPNDSPLPPQSQLADEDSRQDSILGGIDEESRDQNLALISTALVAAEEELNRRPSSQVPVPSQQDPVKSVPPQSRGTASGTIHQNLGNPALRQQQQQNTLEEQSANSAPLQDDKNSPPEQVGQKKDKQSGPSLVDSKNPVVKDSQAVSYTHLTLPTIHLV